MKKVIVLLVLVSLSTFILGTELVGAIGLALPPYVLSETDSGIELDIVKNVLEMGGHTVKPDYVPFARVKHTLSSGKADFALTLTEAAGIENVYYSDSHVTYQNVVVTLKKNNLDISKIADLSNVSISAFQDATLYLGEEYKKTAKGNPEYSEIAKQDKQIALLFGGRVQALVVDINIFKFFRNKTDIVDTSSEVTIHKVFSPSNYKVAFTDKQIRDEFNKNLKKFVASGKKQEIIDQYTK
ncbi:MAG: transporter substrate-binding domain-containing protein [Candidatus Cloacimonadota bacterium]|nr:transporter substrate-binding domain-containing protein [Candidatus Cloacimonadota bacterium]